MNAGVLIPWRADEKKVIRMSQPAAAEIPDRQIGDENFKNWQPGERLPPAFRSITLIMN